MIIEQMPWHCGHDDGCEHGWHLGTYWADDEGGYTYDEFTDGDHEPIEADDLPSPEDVQAAWNRYYAEVAETGDDILGQVTVKTTYKRRRNWWVYFRRSILGCVLVGGCPARKLDRWTGPFDLPDYVRGYLCVEERGAGRKTLFFPEGAQKLKEYAREDESVTLGYPKRPLCAFRLTLKLEEEHTYADARDRVRRAARKALTA